MDTLDILTTTQPVTIDVTYSPFHTPQHDMNTTTYSQATCWHHVDYSSTVRKHTAQPDLLLTELQRHGDSHWLQSSQT